MEQWRDIPGYEGIYQASNLGNIRTHETKTTYSKLHGIRHWKQRVLKQKYCKNARGRTDARVMLWKNGTEKTWLVSRLIGLAWCDGYSDGMTINHINGNSCDNRCENLEWITRADNVKHGFQTGLYDNIQKSVSLIKDGKTYKFLSMAEASRFLGRNSGYVSCCIKRTKAATDSCGNVYSIVYGSEAS